MSSTSRRTCVDGWSEPRAPRAHRPEQLRRERDVDLLRRELPLELGRLDLRELLARAAASSASRIALSRIPVSRSRTSRNACFSCALRPR